MVWNNTKVMFRQGYASANFKSASILSKGARSAGVIGLGVSVGVWGNDMVNVYRTNDYEAAVVSTGRLAGALYLGTTWGAAAAAGRAGSGPGAAVCGFGGSLAGGVTDSIVGEYTAIGINRSIRAVFANPQPLSSRDIYRMVNLGYSF